MQGELGTPVTLDEVLTMQHDGLPLLDYGARLGTCGYTDRPHREQFDANGYSLCPMWREVQP